MILTIVIIFAVSCWFVFALLGAIENIVRGVQEGKNKDELDYGSETFQAPLALAILVFLIVYTAGR